MQKKYPLFLTTLFMAFNSLSAENEVNLPPVDQSFWQTLVMIGIAFIFFYIILWRPEQKKRKELELQRSAMKKGDKVVAMGLIGTVVRVNENTVILKMFDETSKLEFYKAAVTDILSQSEEKSNTISDN